MFGVDAPWTMEGSILDEADRGVSVAFRVGLNNAALDVERLPFMGHGGALRVEEGPSHPIGPFVLVPETAKAAWHALPAVPGAWRIGLMLRHSESGPDDTGLADQYIVTVNGATQPLEWTDLNVHQHGNAYLGMAWTPPVDLSQGPHTINITTTAPWCGIGRTLHLRQTP